MLNDGYRPTAQELALCVLVVMFALACWMF